MAADTSGSMPHSLGGNESRQRKAQRPGGPTESAPASDVRVADAASGRTSDSGGQSDEQRRVLRKAAGASFIGNFIEAAYIASVFF